MNGKKRRVRKWNWLLPILALFSITHYTNAQLTYYSLTNGGTLQWESSNSWTTGSFGSGVNTGTFPKINDTAYIKGTEMEVRNQNANCAQVFLWGDDGKDSKLELQDGKTLNITNDFTLDANGGKKKVHLHNQDTDCQILVGGNFLVTRTAGSQKIVEIKLDKNSLFHINGTATFNCLGGDDAIKLDGKDESVFRIDGNVVLNYNSGDKDIQLNFKQDASMDANSDITFSSRTDDKLEIELKNDAKLRIAGSFIRGAFGAGQNYGILDCQGNSTVHYDGNVVQFFAEDAGAGNDEFIYNNVVVENTSPIIPQLHLENNEGGGATINGTIYFNDGILRVWTQNLIIDKNGDIDGGSNQSYVDVTASNLGALRQNIGGTFTESYPVGDADDYSPMTFTLDLVGGGDYLDFKVTDAVHPALDATQPHITRYWNINSSGFNNIRYNLIYDYVDADPEIDESLIYSVYWNGVSWATYSATDATLNRLSINPWISEIPLGFDFTGGAGAPLPLKEIFFSIVTKKEGAQLNFAVSKDISFDQLLIEKSNDGISYNELVALDVSSLYEKTERVAGAFIDTNPTEGVSYYRITGLEYDGNNLFAHVKPFYREYDELQIIKIFPNPAIGYTYINVFSSQQESINIYVVDAFGKTMMNFLTPVIAGENMIEVDMNEFGEGLYFFRVEQINSRNLGISAIWNYKE